MSVRIPWAEKYRPKRVSEILGNRKAALELYQWVKQWSKGIPKKKAALLYGPPGTGKTTAVYAVANELGYEVVEMNASDIRRAEDIERVIARAVNVSSLFGAKGRIILFDEIDGMSGTEDRGGLSEILRVIEKTRIPIVMTANNPWDPRFRPLRDVALLIRFNRVNKNTLTKILQNICVKEGIKADYSALRLIADMSDGDVRSAINDLQAIAEGRRVLTVEDVKALLAKRYREYDAFTVLKLLFSSRSAEQAKAVLSQSELDYNDLKEWIHENLPLQYSDPEELAKAYDALAKADVYLGRIIKTQNWGLLSYAIDLMTAGVAMARRHPYHFVKYRFPSRMLLLSRTKESRQIRDRVLERIARKTHISRRGAALEYLPYIRAIFHANPQMGAGIARWLELNEEMIEYIAGDKEVARRVIEYMKPRAEIRTKRRGVQGKLF